MILTFKKNGAKIQTVAQMRQNKITERTNRMNGNKLKAKIIENGLNVEEFAKRIGMTRSSLYRQLSNPRRITIGTAERIKAELRMTNEEASNIFFG